MTEALRVARAAAQPSVLILLDQSAAFDKVIRASQAKYFLDLIHILMADPSLCYGVERHPFPIIFPHECLMARCRDPFSLHFNTTCLGAIICSHDFSADDLLHADDTTICNIVQDYCTVSTARLSDISTWKRKATSR